MAYVSHTVAGSICTISLPLKASLCCMYYYHPLADDKIEAQKGKSTCFTVTQEISGRTGIQTQVCADPSSSPLCSACLISANPQTILGGRHNYSSHFKVRVTKAQRDLSDLPKSIPLVSDRAGFRFHGKGHQAGEVRKFHLGLWPRSKSCLVGT